MKENFIVVSRSILEETLSDMSNHVARLHIELINGNVTKETITNGRRIMVLAAAIMEILNWDDNEKIVSAEAGMIDHKLSFDAVQSEVSKIQNQMETGPELRRLLSDTGISME